jgi:histidine triad (HIT) family protein
MEKKSCVFCKIANKEITSNIILENDKALAFLDAYPLRLGHTLIIPKNHYYKINEMDKESLMALFEILWKITGIVEKSVQVNSSTIAIHNGEEAGQEIPHVHIHIIPRKHGDGGGPVHSLFKNNKPIKDDSILLDILNKIKKNL